MTESAEKVADSGWETYRRLLVYVKQYWYAFAVSFVGFALYAGSQTAFARWLEYLVDGLAALPDKSLEREWIAIAVILIFVVRGFGFFLGQYGIAYAGRQIVHALRTSLFARLMVLPGSYYSQNNSGQILSRLTYDVEQVTGAASDALRVLIREGLTIVGLFGYLFYLNWKLTCIFIALGPLIVLVVTFASKRFRRLSREIQSSVGDVAHSAAEAVKGYEVVRIFGGIEVETNRFSAASDRNRRQFMKLVVTQAINTPLVQLLVALALALLVYLATSPAMLQNMSAGEFIAFVTAAGMIAKPLRQMTEVNSIIQKGIAAAESVFSVVDTAAEPDQGTRQLAQVAGELRFEQVTFHYHNEGDAVLKSINLDIPAGKTIALVGRSGSGKTTIANLIPRFYNPQQGAILLDGIPLTEISLSSLREQIALVNQQVVLFQGSIAENIAYGSLANSTREQIEAAAIAAHVDEFASRFPEGLDTMVGENGVMLSGGQRQRIAIARAVLKNAPILILDEATSALDTESERHIQAALQKVMQGRTTLVIAHRLSTVEAADKIVVMDQGEILEQGNHPELLALEGAYARLCRMQFAEEPVTAIITEESK